MGIVAFVIVTALGSDLFLRVEVGFLAGAACAAAAMAVLLGQRMRSGVPKSFMPLAETLGHEPLEI
ncbi:MAG: hypothetical protein M5U14_13925 [Acidimicrobiia bacterium]|nr:hypothetical protein [Acidimicrobiia bacterium]